MSLSYGQLRWRYFGGCGICFGIGLLFFFGGILLVVAYSLKADEETWAKEGQAATATVLDKGTRRERSGKSSKTVNWVTYSYQGPDGKPLTAEAKLPSSQWESLQKKQTIQIEYLRSNPAQSRYATDQPGENWGKWFAAGFGALLTLCGLLLGTMAFVRAGKQARLIFEGTPVLGTVTEIESIEKGNRRNRRLLHKLHYEFTADNGQHYEGSVPNLSDKLLQRWHAGDPILVIHDYNDPPNHLPDLHEARSDELDRLAPRTESENRNERE